MGREKGVEVAQRRKLAAILSADVVGYSRLMGEDEQATLATLTAYRTVMAARITAHEGRVVDAPGDALLAEFPSAVEAVKAAVEIQTELAARNAELPERRRMLLRIGVNLGDVIEQDGALYGDGVNVAARLEHLAEGGGICVSGTVFDQVDGKLLVRFASSGEHTVKNIAKPVRAYKVMTEPGAGGPKPIPLGKRLHRRTAIAAAGLFVAAVAAAWQVTRTRVVPTLNGLDPVLAMPSGPAVAVLPFTNLSGDPGQEYFSDGLTEDIITELARFRDLHVLARNTTAQYKGQTVDVPAVGRKLGVQYVLEGSVRKSGDRIRIAAQLIDARNGAHVWAERYDRALSDVFAVQDEITARIVGTIAGGEFSALKRAEREIAQRKHPEDLQAHDHVLRAKLALEWWGKDYPQSKAHLQKAIELDPSYGRAREEYAWLMLIGWIFRFEKTPAPPAEIKQNAIRAVELDPYDPRAHRTAAYGYFFDKQLNQFEREATAALNLGPNDAQALAQLGLTIALIGQWDRGVQLATKGDTLNADSAAGWYHSTIFYDLYRMERYREAIDVIRMNPNQVLWETQQKYVAAYGQLGEVEKAREHWKKCLATDPDRSVVQLMELWNFEKSFRKHYLEGFAKAGVPVN